MPGFCNLCQLVLSNGTPRANAARVVEYQGRKYIFCSEPCAWIFSREPERYADHKGVVNRILAGEAPANAVKLTRTYFEVTPEVRGKDMLRGRYPWLRAHPETGARQSTGRFRKSKDRGKGAIVLMGLKICNRFAGCVAVNPTFSTGVKK